MSQQGPILVVSSAERPEYAAVLERANLFPAIVASWADATLSVAELAPAAVVADMRNASVSRLTALADATAARKPYLPLIAVDPTTSLPENAIPFSHQRGHSFDRLIARLRAALRVRTLHATVMRRRVAPEGENLPEIDLTREATVLLIGRGGTYPALSVALGERTGVVGALSIEAAAKHLSAREIDGVVFGDGFTTRVLDAFLTVLAEDARFRSLPVVVTSGAVTSAYDLANLEIISGEAPLIATNTLPLVRQHALEGRLSRTLRSIDAGGLIDTRSGLLTADAFSRDLATAVYHSLARGGGLSLARFAFDPAHPRAQLDGARIIRRLMRQMDFGATCADGSVIVVFTETDLRAAHAIARRLTSVMRHTSHGKRDTRAEPTVSVVSLMPSDSAKSLLARLYEEPPRAAS